jgi:hypothetical protein
MPSGYKIRLDDGSEIGPMDIQGVKDWFTQGLINRDSMVQRPGASRWVKLSELAELRDSRPVAAAPAPARARPRSASNASRELQDAVAEAVRGPGGGRGGSATSARGQGQARPSFSIGADNWRTVTAGVFFFLGALIAGVFALKPERWLPALDAVPWKEIALGQALLGLLLIRGWEFGRRIVRVAVLLLAFVLFPLGGILLAQGIRGLALLIPLSAVLLLMGFFALLSADEMPVARIALSLLMVVGGWAGIVKLGLVPETTRLIDVRQWLSPERRYSDDNLDVSLELPGGWSALKREQTLITVPATSKLVMAQPRLGGFGYFAAAPAPRDLASLDVSLSRLLGVRRQATLSLKEEARSDVIAGKVNGREVVGSWEAEGVRYRDLTAVWKDGWTLFALVAWVPDDGSSRPLAELKSLRDAVSLSGEMESHLAQGVETVAREVPHLNEQSAEIVMAQSEAHVLQPEETFRRAYEMASNGLRALTAPEARELGDLVQVASGTLPRKERAQLTSYFERVRDRRLTQPDEDREMCKLMRSAVLRLPAPRLARLQVLYEKAIRAAVTAG